MAGNFGRRQRGRKKPDEIIAEVMEERGIDPETVHRRPGWPEFDPENKDSIIGSQRYVRVRGYGHFYEPSCGHRWQSPYSWCVIDLRQQRIRYRYTQQCRQCRVPCRPTFTEKALKKMAEYACRIYLGEKTEFPNMSDLCVTDGGRHNPSLCRVCKLKGRCTKLTGSSRQNCSIESYPVEELYTNKKASRDVEKNGLVKITHAYTSSQKYAFTFNKTTHLSSSEYDEVEVTRWSYCSSQTSKSLQSKSPDHEDDPCTGSSTSNENSDTHSSMTSLPEIKPECDDKQPSRRSSCIYRDMQNSSTLSEMLQSSQDFGSAKSSDLEQRYEKNEPRSNNYDSSQLTRPTETSVSRIPDSHSVKGVFKAEENGNVQCKINDYRYHSTHRTYIEHAYTNTQSPRSQTETNQPEASFCTIL